MASSRYTNGHALSNDAIPPAPVCYTGAAVFGFELPYVSYRRPVLGANIVATSQPLAAQAGLRMLLQGGNAVDAAIATAIALTVVEPTMNGIGADAFALVWDGEQLHGLNATGRSPSAWTRERFAGLSAMPATGWDAATVPGAVSGWVELSRAFGVLRFEDLFQPAIEYATAGFPVSPFVAQTWAEAAEKYREFESFVDMFMPGGRPPAAGDWFRAPDQARTLQELAETFGESFYRGRLSRMIAQWSRETGGCMTEEDLGAHRAEWVEPLSIGFGDYVLHEMPPNSQGIAALMALGMLRHSTIADAAPDSPEAACLGVSAMSRALEWTRACVADSRHMTTSIDWLLDPERLAREAGTLRKHAPGPSGGTSGNCDDTVYLTAADSSGMMVSMIQSNYFDFGSGLVVPGTGISIHSRAALFSLEPGHPNEVAGGKRPFHTLSPAFVTSHGRPVMSFGVMGGPMQPQGHVQTFLQTCVWGRNPQAAVDAPRWFVDASGSVAVEEGFSPAAIDALQEHGLAVEVAPYGTSTFGGAQMIRVLDRGYCAGSESRKDGQAVAF
jgi:gamma-glutamyltranspeptidase/glutathione hydrolase